MCFTNNRKGRGEHADGALRVVPLTRVKDLSISDTELHSKCLVNHSQCTAYAYIHAYIYTYIYTGCLRRENVDL